MNCRSTKPSNTEAGQASIVVVLMLSLFLLAALAFAVDYTNIWFQRQQAQTAADAACSAGAMDIYQLASGATLPNSGFVLGTGGAVAVTARPVLPCVGMPARMDSTAIPEERPRFPGRFPAQ